MAAKAKIRNQEELNAAIMRLGQLDIAHKEIVNIYKQRAQEMKEETEQDVQPIVDEKAALLGAITDYSTAHREELLAEGGKSRKFFWGVVGWRASTKLVTLGKRTWKQILDMLEDAGKRQFLRITKEVDKEALTRFGEKYPEDLHEMGLAFKATENFYVEPDLVAIADYKPAA